MAESNGGDRRQRDRHSMPVLGMVLFDAGLARGTAQAVNVSIGGILLESEARWPPLGTEVELSFSIEEYGLIFSVHGKIVRLEGQRAAVQFHAESSQIKRVIEKALGVW